MDGDDDEAVAAAVAMSEMERPNSSTALTSSGVGRNRLSVDVEEEEVASMDLAPMSSTSSSSLSETIAELFSSSTASLTTMFEFDAAVAVASSPIEGAGEVDGVGVKSLSEMITGSSSSDMLLLLREGERGTRMQCQLL